MTILDLIFPKKCLECGGGGEYICKNCLSRVNRGGIRKLGGVEIYSLWKYEGVIKKAVIGLKYKYATGITDCLSSLMLQNLKKDSFLPEEATLIPIPIHHLKQNTRGFNQAEIMGVKIASEMKWNFEPNLLVKNVKTEPQVGLKGDARRKNLSGSFSINPSYPLSIIGYPFIIFDDVLTTGSTITEASKVLIGAGYKSVMGLTIAS